MEAHKDGKEKNKKNNKYKEKKFFFFKLWCVCAHFVNSPEMLWGAVGRNLKRNRTFCF